MKYKYLLLLPLGILAMFVVQACTAPANQSITISTARAPGSQCDFSDSTKYVEGGAVDMSVYGTNSGYFQIFSWSSALDNTGVTVNGSALTNGTQNTFIANRIELSYNFVGQATQPPPGIVNISASIPPGGSSTNSDVGIALLTQEAAQIVYPVVKGGAITAQEPISYTLLVTFDVVGTLVGGGAAQTNTITYPLTLFYGISPLAGSLQCPQATVPEVTSCNVPGRDIQYCVCTGINDAGVPVPCPPIK